MSNLLKKLTPWNVIYHLNNTPCKRLIPDTLLVKCLYRTVVGERLNLKDPKTYNEKLQWLKLYDHNPLYTTMVDKCDAKRYIAEHVGEQYVIPTLGVWDDPDAIDWDSLPEQFVLKTTHDSKGVLLCRDKQSFDREHAKQFMRRHLEHNFYLGGREWPYKNVKPRIIAEQYLEDEGDGELRDYKFFTFGGEPKVLYIAQGRNLQGEICADFFDMNFQHLNLTIDHDMAEIMPHKPKKFELMRDLSAKLSAGIPHLRVDLYEANGRIYVGELTFFHCSGLESIHPDYWNRIFGDWITLPKKQI